jgi:hypothetical protein
VTDRRRTLLCLSLLAAACGGKAAAPPPPAAGGAGAETGDLTAFQTEHGIGPVTTAVTLGSLDPTLADSVKSIFAG